MSKSSQFFEHILTHYRGIFATLILLPLSTLYTAYTTVRNGLVFKMRSAPAKHDQKVQKIIDQIEDWKQAGCTQRLCKYPCKINLTF